MKKLLLPIFSLATFALFGQAGGIDTLSIAPTNDPKIEKFNFSAYPNPANEVLDITSSLTQSTDLWVTVTNSHGQIVRRELWKNNSSNFNGRINTSGIPGGIYSIHLSNGSSSVFEKIVIVH